MSLASAAAARMTRPQEAPNAPRGNGPVRKLGEEIVEGPYPKKMSEMVGQDQAKTMLMTAMVSAFKRGEPLDHVLLASGHAGIGKTALARLIAYQLGVGFVELGGTVTVKNAQAALATMRAGDVLFLDEIHRLVSYRKTNAEWLLYLLQDGVLVTPTGVIAVPKITVVAATTDAQKLPRTVLSRFAITPYLEPYTPDEAVEIARGAAGRMGFGSLLPLPDNDGWLHRVAAATDYNPRGITQLLKTVRDIALATDYSNYHETNGYDVTVALEWNGLTPDGLTRVAQDYLMAVLAFGGVASLSSIMAMLNESVLDDTERVLIQRGFVAITSKGRALTPLGNQRATELVDLHEGEAE